MAGITGMGTTFNLPNYVGELFSETPTDTPFLSAIGGLTGGMAVNATLFQWQGYDLRDAADDRQRTEGADAPAAEARVRFSVHNVLEIHQEALDVSYTKQAAVGQFNSTGSNHPGSIGIAGMDPVTDEVDWQTRQQLIQIARDVEQSFITGTFQNPADNLTPRKTRGILQAITTNVVDAAGAELDSDNGGAAEPGYLLLDLMQSVWENGGIQVSETATVMCNAYQKRKITKAFITDRNYQEQTRNVGGVSLTTIETDFGRLNIMLNRYMPTDQVAVVSLEECAPAFMLVPGKGFLFVEPLAKVGSSNRYQIYGEIGLKYGNQKTHGKIINLADGTGS
ncbi:SU10 major capsid protein [Streptomyces sp. bgisy153]|uniref:SU10 major capsid protein n=1 Tax=Streptomyces sp. bgisy153 TaxID=3413793 RepID=UPI003D70ACD6